MIKRTILLSGLILALFTVKNSAARLVELRVVEIAIQHESRLYLQGGN
ncbi:MAG: hypothetical protein K9J30_10970 [Bacteroidales bacterium]|nr:hypothetical protein [Bacteroidales bacterium]